MAITSHESDFDKPGEHRAYIFSLVLSLALLLALIFLIVPSAAVADIYKWTDEKGRTWLSNVPPAKSEKVTNFELMAKDAQPASKSPAHVATPTEQALLNRIESLERQLQARQYAAQAPAVPPQVSYGSYYPSPPPPPPPMGYYGSYYPSYYPSYYYPVVPAYSYGVYPIRTVITRPAFGFSHGSGIHGGGGHRGRR